MGWYNPATWFKTSEKAVNMADKVVDGAIAGIDKLFFTEEERAEFSKAAGGQFLKFQEIIFKENTTRSITRRILAVMVMGVFLSFLVFAVAIWGINPEWAKFTLEVSSNLSTGFTAIIICYFGYYSIGSLMDKRKNGT